jgi:DNA-binding Lrp family transcriptional regulator
MSYIVWESLLPGKLGDYGVNIYPSELMNTNFGYFPIASATITRFAKGVDDTDKALLALLADDSRISLSKLSRSLKISRNTLYYRLFALKKEIIKRFTLSVNEPPFGYILAYVVNYRFNKTSHNRSINMMEYYKSYDDGLPFLNTFQLLAPMSGSHRFFGMGLFSNRADAVKNAIIAHKNIFNQENPEIKYARVTGIVKGTLPFRNIDIKNNYTRFRWSEADLEKK